MFEKTLERLAAPQMCTDQWRRVVNFTFGGGGGEEAERCDKGALMYRRSTSDEQKIHTQKKIEIKVFPVSESEFISPA